MLNTVLGLVVLATLPLVVRGLVVMRVGLARGLLTNQTAALRARAERLAAGRRAAVAAEAQTLRRVERDIHDGPQQRLVRLNMAARRRDPLGALSPREREVLALMAEGRTNTAIGRALVITQGAVEKHISSIFGKLGLPPSADDHRRGIAVLAWLGVGA